MPPTVLEEEFLGAIPLWVVRGRRLMSSPFKQATDGFLIYPDNKRPSRLRLSVLD
jgi:hypothetical protein